MVTDIQKTVFAEKHLRRPSDVYMNLANIVGNDVFSSDPFYWMSLAESLPNDEFVLSEIERIKNTPKTKNERVIEWENLSNEARKIGDYDAVHKFQRLIAEADGIVGKNSKDESTDDSKIYRKELFDKIVNVK
jgi:hypothetical protein